MKNKIRRVISINNEGTKTLEVGSDGISEIKDNSVDYENSVHIQFDAYDIDGELVGTFMNGALSIDYFKS